jgi:hypothetical protein
MKHRSAAAMTARSCVWSHGKGEGQASLNVPRHRLDANLNVTAPVSLQGHSEIFISEWWVDFAAQGLVKRDDPLAEEVKRSWMFVRAGIDRATEGAAYEVDKVMIAMAVWISLRRMEKNTTVSIRE